MMNEHKLQNQPFPTCPSPLLRPLPQLSPSQPLIRLQTPELPTAASSSSQGTGRQRPVQPGNNAKAGGRVYQRHCQLPSSLWPPPSELIPWGLRRLVLKRDRNEGPMMGTRGILQLALFGRVTPHRPRLAPAAGGGHLPPSTQGARTCTLAHARTHTPRGSHLFSHPVPPTHYRLRRPRLGLTLGFTVY